MTDDEALMARLAITAEAKTIYHYAGFRYERLEDAVRYAEAGSARSDMSVLENSEAESSVGAGK